MANGEVFVSGEEDHFAVKVAGRATFECVAPLRDLAGKLDNISFSKVDIDLGGCLGMDSTFMGVLAMMALRAKKAKAVITVWNADDMNKNLLAGLGLKKLFQYQDGVVEMGQVNADSNTGVPLGKLENATTVLEAHKTLMDVDSDNVAKFEKVVEFVQKDLDKLNEK
ncbi:MAG: hypothetical protein J6S58_11180 [Lentisphaeria bacterium]|nr:hypothetical protein [Lentisphaeria bacterium]